MGGGYWLEDMVAMTWHYWQITIWQGECDILCLDGWATDDLVYKWKDVDPVQIVPGLHLPRFTLEQYKSAYCNVITNTGTLVTLSSHFLWWHCRHKYLFIQQGEQRDKMKEKNWFKTRLNPTFCYSSRLLKGFLKLSFLFLIFITKISCLEFQFQIFPNLCN